MKATIQTHYGSPRVLRIEEVQQPTIAAHEVRVEVHASAVTQGDRRLRAADFPGMGALFGRLMFGIVRPRNRTPGTVFAGKIVEIGEKVTRFRVGDRVFGSCSSGAQAEYVAVAQNSTIAEIPDGIGFDEAAAVPYGAGTALSFLRDVAEVLPGERVLIIGASGGVGRFAVQVARHLGAEVTGVCSTRNLEMVKDLGAQHVIDYSVEDYTKNGETYDVIFDTASGDGFRAAKGSLGSRGRYVSVYMSLLIGLQLLRSMLFGGPRPMASVALGNRRLLEDVANLMADRAIQPVIAARFPLAQVVDAHEELERGTIAGAVIVSMVDEPERDLTLVCAAE